MTKRQKIISTLVELFKQINGTSPYISNLFSNVKGKMVFWDEVNQYPLVALTAGSESREYLPGNFKWGFLTVNIRIYVKGDDAKERLENIFVDIENILDANNTLAIGDNGEDICTDIRILSISDDEGLLAPHGVGEVTIQIQYPA